MNPFGNQLLNVITYLPMVGALIILVGMRESSKATIARFAAVIAGLDLLLALPLWFGWDAAAQDAFGFRFVHEANWIESIGVKYVVGVDGISISGLSFEGFDTKGVDVEFSSAVEIERCTFRRGDSTGVYVTSTDDVTVSLCTFEDIESRAIYAAGCTDVVQTAPHTFQLRPRRA